MRNTRLMRIAVIGSLILSAAFSTFAQTSRQDAQFGPVVRAYLGYLRNEQEVAQRDARSARQARLAAERDLASAERLHSRYS